MLRAQACAIGHNHYGGISKDINVEVQTKRERIERTFAGKVTKSPESWVGDPGKAYGIRTSVLYGFAKPGGYTEPVCGGLSITVNEDDFLPGRQEFEFINLETVASAYEQPLHQLHNDLLPITKRIVVDREPVPVKEILDAKYRYQQAVAHRIAAGFGDLSKTDERWRSWLWAGAMFSEMARINRAVLQVASIQPKKIPITPSTFYERSAAYDTMSKGMRQMESYLRSVEYADFTRRTGIASAQKDVDEPENGWSEKVIRKSFSRVEEFLKTGVLNMVTVGFDTDLVSALSGIGQFLLIIPWMTFVGVVMASVAFNAGISVATFLSPLTFWAAATGTFLANWIPMLPMYIWYMGVISWLVVCAEGVIATPLWAITHFDVEGEEVHSARSAYGYTFLVNVLFRPMLMILGLLIGGLIVKAAGPLVVEMFRIMLLGKGLSPLQLLFAVVFFGFAAAVVGFFTITTAFSLIHVVPDQVLAWIGHNYRAPGTTDEYQARQVIGGGIGTVKRGGAEAMRGRGGNNKETTERQSTTAGKKVD